MSESVSDQIAHVLQKALWPLLGVAAIAVVASLAMTYKKSRDYKKLVLVQDELFVLRKDVETIAKKYAPDDPLSPEATAGKISPKKAEKPKPAPEELQKAYAEPVAKLQNFIKANQGTQPAAEAAVLVSDLANEYKKYDEGIVALQTALEKMDRDQFIYGVAQAELGNLLAKTDKCQEATEAWAAVIGRPQHEFLSTNLRLKSGVCFEKLGMYDRAEKLYQDVVEKSPASSAATTAKKFLLHIKYVKNKAVESEKAPATKNG